MILSLLSSSFRMSSSFLPSFAARTVSRGFAEPKGFCSSIISSMSGRDSNKNLPPKPHQSASWGVGATHQCCCFDTYGSARLFLSLSFGSCAFIPGLQVEFSSLRNISGGLTFHMLFGCDRVTCLHAQLGGIAGRTHLSRDAVLGVHAAVCSCESF